MSVTLTSPFFKEMDETTGWRIERIQRGRYYMPGSYEDGPAIDILIDPLKRDGYVLTVSRKGYLRAINKESFSTSKEEVEKYLKDNQ